MKTSDERDSLVSDAATRMDKYTVRTKVNELPQSCQLDASSVLARESTPQAISEWFISTCKATLRTSKHLLSLDQEEPHYAHGPDCCICQDTSLDCLLFLSLPCCNCSVGDLCLLNWFLGCSSTAADGIHLPVTNTTCPACRTLLFSKPVLSQPDQPETESELAAAVALSSALLTESGLAPIRNSTAPLQQTAAFPQRKKWWHFGRAFKTNAYVSSRRGGRGCKVFNSCPSLLRISGSTRAQRAWSSSDSLDVNATP